ncbi:hypothetical protein EON71_00595 [bacterium]|nr:MAG: hypothetical protein EON71_00595 [bacterium]
MHPENFRYYDEYSGFLYKFSTWHNRFILFFLLREIYWFHFNRMKIYLLLKHGFTILLMLIFLYEILFKNFCLHYFVLILPWYSLYKLLYGFNSYIIYNMDYLYDLVVSGSIYSVDESLHHRLYSELDHQDNFFQFDEYTNVREYIRNKLFSK